MFFFSFQLSISSFELLHILTFSKSKVTQFVYFFSLSMVFSSFSSFRRWVLWHVIYVDNRYTQMVLLMNGVLLFFIFGERKKVLRQKRIILKCLQCIWSPAARKKRTLKWNYFCNWTKIILVIGLCLYSFLFRWVFYSQ